MRTFLKGFCIGLLCLSLLGDVYKRQVPPLPGAESSGEEPAGNEQTGQEQEPQAIVDLPALQAEYPDIKGWITIPGTCVDYPVLQLSLIHI